MAPQPLRLFALQATDEFGAAVAAALSEPLAAHQEREFEDREHKVRPLETVRWADVFVGSVTQRQRTAQLRDMEPKNARCM